MAVLNSVKFNDVYSMNKKTHTPEEKRALKLLFDSRDSNDNFFSQLTQGFANQNANPAAVLVPVNQDPIPVVNLNNEEIGENLEVGNIGGEQADMGVEEIDVADQGLAGAQATPAVDLMPTPVAGGSGTVPRRGRAAGSAAATPVTTATGTGRGGARGRTSKNTSPILADLQQKDQLKLVDVLLPTTIDNPVHFIHPDDFDKMLGYCPQTAARVLLERAEQIFDDKDPNKNVWVSNYYQQYDQKRKITERHPENDVTHFIPLEEALSSTMITCEEDMPQEVYNNLKLRVANSLVPLQTQKRSQSKVFELIENQAKEGKKLPPRNRSKSRLNSMNTSVDFEKLIEQKITEIMEKRGRSATKKNRSKSRNRSGKSRSKSKSKGREVVKNYNIKNYYNSDGSKVEDDGSKSAESKEKEKKKKKKGTKYVRSSSGNFYKIADSRSQSRARSQSRGKGNSRNRGNDRNRSNSNAKGRSKNNSRGRQRSSSQGNPRKHQSRDNSPVRCYVCQEIGHLASNCKNIICYKCNKRGHIRPNCPEKN